ncbi:histidine kinase [Nostoc sp. CMAA1605]|nr:histidine kinase [Nostoc sp. CMAA1605]
MGDKGDKGDKGDREGNLLPCPIPNAPFPMPYSQCPIPIANAQNHRLHLH